MITKCFTCENSSVRFQATSFVRKSFSFTHLMKAVRQVWSSYCRQLSIGSIDSLS